MAEAEESTGVGFGTTRVEALTDGVFAIAMTLLVFDISVPEVAGAKLPSALLALWPRFLTYALSFVVLGIYWIGHHGQFRFIRRTDRVLLWLNVALLMAVALVPFSTGLLGRYPDEPLSVSLYGATLVLIGLVNYVHWWYATYGHRLVDADIDPRLVHLVKVRIAVAPLVCLVAIGISLLSATAAIALMVLMIPLYILPGRLDRFFAHHPLR